MRCPALNELPPPLPGKTGWPWTEESPQLPDTMPDGSSWPRISIVTPSYNQGQFIEETIRSVLLQGYPNLEYIIIDGGSTDNSVEIIKKYEPWLAYWVSEPDRGQAHAITKGLERATGDIFNWINSDDSLTPGALRIVAEAFGDSHAIAGAVLNFGERGQKTVIANRALDPINMIRGDTGVVFHQPGLWLRRKAAIQCGGIDEQFHYAFDWDLTIRYLSLYPHVTYSRAVLACFRLHDKSKTVRNPGVFDKERIDILKKLLTLDQYKSLHKECRRRLRLVIWWTILDQLLNDETLSPWVRALRIILLACADPSARWSRLTLGAIRRSVGIP